MRELMCLLGALWLLCPPAAAEDAPKVDLHLGYSLVRATLGAVPPNPVPVNLHGGGGSIAYNVTKELGIVADVGLYNFSGAAGGGGNLSSYLFGPRLSYRGHRRFRPYLHLLVGLAHAARQVFEAPLAQNSFALTAGGGLDIKLFDGIALRFGQAEIFHTRFRVGTSTTPRSQNNVRISSGIVFSFGK